MSVAAYLYSQPLLRVPEAVTGRLQLTSPIAEDATLSRFGSSATAALPVAAGNGWINTAMNFLVENKIRELILTDLFLMVLPRTTIEATLRDKRAKLDAVRETLMREVLTTVAMVFTMPTLGHAVQQLHDRSPALNPHGMFGGAWITDACLREFQSLWRETLRQQSSADPAKARERFLDRALQSIQNGDERLVQALHQLAPQAGLLPDKNGMITRMKTLFQNHANPAEGIFPVEQVTDALVAQRRSLSAAYRQDRKPGSLDETRQRWQTRIKESRASAEAENDWLRRAHAILDAHQFGDTLRMPLGGQENRVFSRDEWLLNLRNFTQQVVDRSLHDGKHDASAVLEHAEALATHLHRSKLFLTWLPFALALTLGRAVPVVSNAITRTLHGGKKYFPGDVALMQEPAPRHQAATKPKPIAGHRQANLSLYSHAFESFQMATAPHPALPVAEPEGSAA